MFSQIERIVKPWYKSLGVTGSIGAEIGTLLLLASFPIEANVKHIYGVDSNAYQLLKPWVELIRYIGGSGAVAGPIVGAVGRVKVGDVSTPKFMPGPNRDDPVSFTRDTAETVDSIINRLGQRK